MTQPTATPQPEWSGYPPPGEHDPSAYPPPAVPPPPPAGTPVIAPAGPMTHPPMASPVPPPGYKAFGYATTAETTPQQWAPPPQWPAQQAPHWPGQPPPPRRSRARFVLVPVAALAALVLVGVGLDLVLGTPTDPLYTPERVGSASRLTSGAARDMERDMLAGLSDVGQAQVGVYGRNGRPQYVLAAGYGVEDDGREVFDGFVEEADGIKVGKPKEMAPGLTCATMTSDGSRGAICTWGGDASDGMVMSFNKPDLDALAKLAAKARTDVETGPAL